jgi:hypothetical protein
MFLDLTCSHWFQNHIKSSHCSECCHRVDNTDDNSEEKSGGTVSFKDGGFMGLPCKIYPVFLSVAHICPSVCLSVCLSVNFLSVCLSACLSACLPVCLFVCLSIYLYFSVCLSVCLSFGLSVWLSVCLPICLSVYHSRLY